MALRLRILFLVFFGGIAVLFAQITPETESTIEDKVENLVENLEEDSDVDISVLYEQLEYLLESPISLNTASVDELSELILLNHFQILTLIDYREKFGNLLSLYELLSIDGWDMQTVIQILPYITLDIDKKSERISFAQLRKRGKNSVIIRGQQVLEEMKGYSYASDSLLAANPNARYLGSPLKLYTRYQYRYRNRIIFGFTMEKDPGEELFKGSQPQGFDFMSAHLFIRNFGIIKRLALGDFEAKFGQGLVMWSGLAFGKSTDVMSTGKNAPGIKQYSSANEFGFLRGGGVTIGNRFVDASFFYSAKKVDATLRTDTLDMEENYISSMLEDGYHRTPNEMSKRRVLDENIIGGNLTFRTRSFLVGLTGVHTKYGYPIIKPDRLYNRFEFAGQSNSTAGVNYQYQYKHIKLAGETGMSENGAVATLNTASLSLSPRVATSIVYRYYPKDYHAIMSAAFGENSRNANEEGLFYGVRVFPYAGWTINAYYDLFRFRWLKYQTNAPTIGHDAFAEAIYRPNRRTEISFRYREKVKSRTHTSEALINSVEPYVKQSYRLHLVFNASREINIKTRAELCHYSFADRPVSKGYLFYQDINYRPRSKPYNFSFRYALFDTDDYNSRMYAYENDVLYAFSIAPYYYRGTRMYLLMKYEFSRKLHCWLRFGQTYFNDRSVISSGLNEIQGNTRSEIKAQIRYKF